MTRLKIIGWNAGFNKVSFTQLLCEGLKQSLSHAHQATENLCNGQVITIEVEEFVAAQEFIRAAQAIGAKLEITSEGS